MIKSTIIKSQNNVFATSIQLEKIEILKNQNFILVSTLSSKINNNNFKKLHNTIKAIKLKTI
jgi:hypothetical protein